MTGLFKPKKKTGRVKILLVDDKRDIVEIIQYRLNLFGWEVITSSDGKEGLKMAEDEKPDLIVLDINMPIMNGHKMLDSLRANPALRDNPVIMCTISNRIEDITKASSFNISDYVTKPFNCTELAEKIREVLENKASD